MSLISTAYAVKPQASPVRGGRAAWVECEMGESSEPQFPAQMLAHAHVGGGEVRAFPIARCSYHPRVVKVDDAAAEQFRRSVQR